MKNILIIDNSEKSSHLSSNTVHTATVGSNATEILNKEKGLSQLNSNKHFDILVCNEPDYEVLHKFKEKFANGTSILITDLTMDQYSYELKNIEDRLVDHILANRAPCTWTTKELIITLQKLIRNDYFGLDKYLTYGTSIHQLSVQDYENRESIDKQVQAFVIEKKLGNYLAKTAYGICEELLMNAIVDAPLAGKRYRESAASFDQQGIGKKEHQPKEVTPILSYGWDGSILGISICDYFGALQKSTFGKYLKKITHRDNLSKLIDTKKEGAGLGFFKILYGSHTLICNVQANKQTEIIALILTSEQLKDFSRMARSICFFEAT
ncbi:MAG: hypothetical protein R3B45_06900 [Bdellovibrionota bacterium]